MTPLDTAAEKAVAERADGPTRPDVIPCDGGYAAFTAGKVRGS